MCRPVEEQLEVEAATTTITTRSEVNGRNLPGLTIETVASIHMSLGIRRGMPGEVGALLKGHSRALYQNNWLYCSTIEDCRNRAFRLSSAFSSKKACQVYRIGSKKVKKKEEERSGLIIIEYCNYNDIMRCHYEHSRYTPLNLLKRSQKNFLASRLKLALAGYFFKF